MHYFIDVLKKYAVFSGRARRAEYWYFYLFNLLIGIAISIVGLIITFISGDFSTMIIVNILAWIYSLAILLPALGVTVRRLHDTGKSGWMMFIVLIPFVGAIWLLVLMCLDSDPGENEYGPNPKGTQSSTTPSTNPTTSQFVKYDNTESQTNQTPTQPEQPASTQ